MCGIAAIVDFEAGAELSIAEAMASSLSHRGRDDAGVFFDGDVALAHRRLAIIDLTRAGRQPMADVAQRYTIVFNGEIYNYRELRRELESDGYSFSSETDTEVLLASYAAWGPMCLQRFEGMWGFAIWDATTRELFCARDRFGIKPLYYRHDGHRLAVASELKAFRHDEASLEPDAQMLHDFLTHGLVDHTEQTFFAGIKQLKPAHFLVFNAEGLRTERYWNLGRTSPARLGDDEVQSFRAAFLDSVRSQLRSDVSIGTCLSGGLDSSAIACAVDHLMRGGSDVAEAIGPIQQTFTVFFADPRIDERRYARAVAAKIGAETHFLSFGERELIDALPAVVTAQDEPFRSSSVVAQWFVMREASRAGQRVMLDGQGGDELLAGYHGFGGFWFRDLLMHGQFRRLLSEVSGYRATHGASLQDVTQALVRPYVPTRWRWRAAAFASRTGGMTHHGLHADATGVAEASPFASALKRQLHFVLARRLPELLHYEDRNSMAHSIEARVPFLDTRLVETAFALDESHLINGGQTKVVLREALSDLLPDVVTKRRDKLGFETPERQWMQGELGRYALDVFRSKRFRDREFVNRDNAIKRLQAVRVGKSNATQDVWRAMSVELWAREFLD